MKLNRFLLVLGLTAIGLTTASKKASALTWTIGNYTDTGYLQAGDRVFGQSFNPSILGDSGVGTPSSAASIITNWSFYSNAAPTSGGKLYIFSAPYSGPSTLLKNTTTNLI